MPRSFLVKKYFSNKKPCYRESHLESQSGKFDFCSDPETAMRQSLDLDLDIPPSVLTLAN